MKADTGVIDVSVWVGSYPFRGIPSSSIGDLKVLCNRLGISQVVASSFENLFWENGLDAYEMWQEELADEDWCEHWPVVNPAMPGQIRAVKELVERFRPGGLRLLPNYHSYSLQENCVRELMCLAREKRLIVQVFQRIADERWHWMLRVPAVEQEQLEAFAGEHTDQPIIISGTNQPALFSRHMHNDNQLYVDTSRIRGPVFAFEELIRTIPADRILFGSLWPIQIPQATLWQIQGTDMPEKNQSQILGRNYRALLRNMQ